MASKRKQPGRSRSKSPNGEKDQVLKNVLDHIQPVFLEDGAKKIGHQDLRSIVDSADELWTKFSEGETLRRFVKDAELMIALLRDYRTGRYSTPSYWSIAVIVFTMQYVLKPVDIIPDSLPVIGQLDDAMVVAHCLDMAEQDLRAYKVWRMADNIDP